MRIPLLAWTVATDPSATRFGYRAIPVGASALCGCVPCRNFDAARPDHFPPELSDLLASAGIDARKEASVRLVAPLESRLHLYSGSYVLCGEILSGRPHRGFPFLREEVDVFERVAPSAHVALRPWSGADPPPLGPPCIALEFLVVLPWVLADTGTGVVELHRRAGRFTS